MLTSSGGSVCKKTHFGHSGSFRLFYGCEKMNSEILKLNKIDYKVLYRIDFFEIFYGGDRLRQGLSFEI